MKAKVTKVIHRSGYEEKMNGCNVSTTTFYELQSHGSKALKNLLKQVELCTWIGIDSIESIELELSDSHWVEYYSVELASY